MNRIDARAVWMTLVVAVATLGGCAAERHIESPDSASLSPADAISRARAALAVARDHRFADGVPVEVARAEQWLAEAERLISEGDGGDEVTELTLRALRAQLGALNAYFARREAEVALEGARSSYENRKSGLDALEEETRLLEDEDLP